jgi:hypothetical protein
MRIENCSNGKAMQLLEQRIAGSASFSFQKKKDFQPESQNKQTITICNTCVLTNLGLLDYLRERSMNIEIAKQHCQEVHYIVNGKPYFAVGFRNDAGGYELRNNYFKGCTSKDVTTVKVGSNTCQLFEGFMDYLSFLTIKNWQQAKADVIVLNSLNNLVKVKNILTTYGSIATFLDNDAAGKRVVQELKSCYRNVTDHSEFYVKHKDLNDYLGYKTCFPKSRFARVSDFERTIDPANADKSRSYLNRELIDFPDGVTNRTEAIQYRIETAGITRKISTSQVRALRFMLTGTSEDMKRIEASGRLDDWCRDNVDWLKKTFGIENLVSAVLHMDEKTPHIHATVVPIVSGERRKVKTAKPDDGKKKYRKKNPNATRLCADNIMARDKLKRYQDSYAEAMNKYGLQRGVDGSEAKHINTQTYYRELHLKNETLKEDNEVLQEQKEEAYLKVRDMYDRKDEARGKFLDMDRRVQNKIEELATVETKLQKARQEYKPYQAQEDLNLIYELFPMMEEQFRIADFCKNIGLAIESIKSLLASRILTAKSFSFFSPEHNQKFKAENVNLKIEKEPDNQNKLRLNINGINILDWFTAKYQEIQQRFGIDRKPEINKNKGIRM